MLPNDLQDEPYEEPPRAHGTLRSGVGYTAPKTMPYDADLDRAAEVLNSGKKVAILVGAGSLARDRRANCRGGSAVRRCAKALLGKAALPDDLPWVTGSIGLLGTKPSYQLMTECDTLLMIGSAFPYSEFLPKEGKVRGVQIDIDASMLSIRYPMEVSLVGDAEETLRALLPRLQQNPRTVGAKTIEGNVKEWWKTLEDRARQPAKPVNPQRVTWELSPRLPERAIVTSDSGSCANWFARDLKMRRGMKASLSGGLASMGAAVPYAIAAKYRPSGSSSDCVGRRRRHADEQHGRTDHGRQILARVARSSLDRLRVQQRRSQPGDLGAAGHRGRPKVRSLADESRTSPITALPK